MNEDILPQELSELEARIQSHDAPAEGLRGRVLGAVAANLSAQPRSSGGAGYAAAIAAVVLIGMSLSLVAASVTRFGEPVRAMPVNIAETSEALRRLAPGLTVGEADQLVLTSTAAAGPGGMSLVPTLVPAPANDAGAGGLP